MKTIETDYLIIGAGAMGMAFVDVLLRETSATFVIVDKYDQPGGHWNTAYPFVRLHQPSEFYGVASKALGARHIDKVGWNAGLYELASVGEVCAYFDQVMQQQFLPSGRVTFLPMSEYRGNGRVVSLVSGEQIDVAARRTVDATYMRVTVPSMREPPYAVDEGVVCIPPNELPKRAAHFHGYTVVGAGKTGMDACLWLLKQGVDPGRITWITPRDSWLVDRGLTQPAEQFAESTRAVMAGQMQAISSATSVSDLMKRINGCGRLLKLERADIPTMYRCATVSKAEIEQLQRIENVVRLGRVRRIRRDEILLDAGAIATDPQTLFVDCTADGLEKRPIVPVFSDSRITLQALRSCQQVFSAALIAHIEAAYEEEDRKNDLATPVPHPDTDVDFLRVTIANAQNQIK